MNVEADPDIGMCARCDKRSTCVELCIDAEEYASQDYKKALTPAIKDMVFLGNKQLSNFPVEDFWDGVEFAITTRRNTGGRLILGPEEWTAFDKYLEERGFSLAEALIMYKLYWKGETLSQVGDHFGVSKQAIHKTLNRLKRKLKKS